MYRYKKDIKWKHDRPYDRDKLIKLRDRFSMAEIGLIYGVGRTAMYYVFKKLGIEPIRAKGSSVTAKMLMAEKEL